MFFIIFEEIYYNMTKKDEIIQLFNSLPGDERNKVLKELNTQTTLDTMFIEDAPIVCCPHCDSKLFIKNGRRGDLQKYKCKSCCKVFTSRTGTSLHRLQKINKFEAYKALMLKGYFTIQQMATQIGISTQTAFDWRHKILSGVSGSDCNDKFEGITEIDDIWFLYSQKGRKGLGFSRKRGGSKRAGDNDFQAKLLITSDRNKTTDMSVVRIGRLNKSDIQRKISGRFSNESTLVSDKHRSISSFAKSEELKHVSFKASEHSAGGEFHVQNINGMASRLKGIINHTLRGVSTKYLQSYANWYKLNLKKMGTFEVDTLMTKNKKVTDLHENREAIYKWFIENFSKRTYRCPVKRTFLSKLEPEMIAKLGFI